MHIAPGWYAQHPTSVHCLQVVMDLLVGETQKQHNMHCCTYVACAHSTKGMPFSQLQGLRHTFLKRDAPIWCYATLKHGVASVGKAIRNNSASRLHCQAIAQCSGLPIWSICTSFCYLRGWLQSLLFTTMVKNNSADKKISLNEIIICTKNKN